MTTADDAETDLVRELKGLRAEPPGATAFAAALHRRLAAEMPPRAPAWSARLRERVLRPALLWPLVGTVCGVLAFLVMGRLAGRSEVARAPRPAQVVAHGEVAPTYLVPSSKVAVIKLNFAASVDVADVDFEVELPEGLAFWSGGKKLAERVFRWPGELHAGDNLIPVVVRGERPGLYRVRARATVAGEIVHHEVVLDVREGA
jgi:hypothetical protein